MMGATFNTLLIKTASSDRSITFLSKAVVVSKMVKQAKIETIKGTFRKCALEEGATTTTTGSQPKEKSDFMKWWDDDANKAGVVTAGLGGLLGYGLMPGKNKIMKLLAALGLGAAGYFGGQALWPTAKGWFSSNKTTPAEANKAESTTAGQNASETAATANTASTTAAMN